MDNNQEAISICDMNHLACALECLLFASADPVPIDRLAKVLLCDEAGVRAAAEALDVLLERHGLQVLRLAGGYTLGTRPEYVDYLNRLCEPPRERLSAAALEVLAIVAYRQPVTKADIDAVRGVDSSGALRTLLDKRLIAVQGRKQAPGRPMLFVTTVEFLRAFGLQDLSELPEVPGALVQRVRQMTLNEETEEGEAKGDEVSDEDLQAHPSAQGAEAVVGSNAEATPKVPDASWRVQTDTTDEQLAASGPEDTAGICEEQ